MPRTRRDARERKRVRDDPPAAGNRGERARGGTARAGLDRRPGRSVNRRRTCAGAHDRGSGTIWLLALSLLVGLVAAAGVLRGVAVVARHRAEAAADLAALAAAQRALEGVDKACAEAARVAGINRTVLVRCAAVGDVVTVEVGRPLRLGRLGSWMVVARANAGPATAAARAP